LKADYPFSRLARSDLRRRVPNFTFRAATSRLPIS
jgi:hypothetical protein